MRPGRGAGISVKLMGGGAVGGGPPSQWNWKTATPYIYVALAFLMGAIAVSLLVLICMRRKATTSSSDDEEKKKAAAARALVPLDREPKVVVFMPGDHHAPSFLASVKPLGDGGAATV